MKEKPDIIEQVGFDFNWDLRKVWELKYPVEDMNIQELTWHFDVPFLSSKPNGYYDVYPRQILDSPENFPEEYQRTMNSDTKYPIDIMLWRKHWLILDGLHRLMRLHIEKVNIVKVRKIPQSAIPSIKKLAS